MDSKLFWGLLIILIGVSIIINHVFKVDFPLFKVIIALVIIYFGVTMLLGSFNFKSGSSGDQSSVFTSQNYAPDLIDRSEEYNCLFGSSKIDLRNTNFEEKNIELEVNAVFGSVKLYLPENVKVRIKASSAFGSVRSKDHQQDGIGDQEFSEGSRTGDVEITVKASAVFGSVRIY